MLDFKNKSFYVYGLGITGKACIKFLQSKKAKVFAYDDNQDNVAALGENIARSVKVMDWKNLDYLLLSPGIQILKDHEHPVYLTAKRHNIELISDIDLLYLSAPKAKYVAITGTNGKSTTTALLGHILEACNIKSYIGGNIGISVLELPIDDEAVYVLETSSFQLDLISQIQFDISCLTNLTKDHLDRHGTMENYLESKLNAFRMQKPGGYKLYSIDYDYTKNLGERFADALTISTKSKNASFYSTDRVIHDSTRNLSFDLSGMETLRGEHNMENILFAYALAAHLGAKPDQIVEAIKSFKGLNHRMELVSKYHGLTFVNDSKATNADAAEKALKSYDNIIWIAGGVAKDGGIESLAPLKGKLLHTFLIGESKTQFVIELEKWGSPYTITDTLDNTLQKIHSNYVNTNAIVLLSPACASFDQFKNFEQRGDVFKELVKKYFK